MDDLERIVHEANARWAAAEAAHQKRMALMRADHRRRMRTIDRWSVIAICFCALVAVVLVGSAIAGNSRAQATQNCECAP